MPEIIRVITTPLSLAALGLLLIIGLLRLLIAQKATKQAKAALHYSFIFAFTLVILANVTFMWGQMMAREIRVAGSVYGTGDQPLGNVLIDFAGVSRGATLDDGRFEFTIPASRAQDSYDVVVSRLGYESANLSVSGKQPKPLRIELKRILPTASNTLAISGQVGVRSYLGLPQMDIMFEFSNPLPAEIQYEELAISVTADDGSELLSKVEGTYLPTGGQPVLAAPMFTILVPGKQSTKWAYSLFAPSSEFQSMVAEAHQLATPDVAFGRRLPGRGEGVIDRELAARMRGFSERQRGWTAGTWQVKVRYRIDKQNFERTYVFSLGAPEVSGMLASQFLIESGIGVLTPIRYLEADGFRPAVSVNPQLMK